MEWLLLLVASVHLILCPFTKVEESFNVQAMHDILYHGTNLSSYDHLEFPGVVPRTFIGPLIIAVLAAPWVCAVNYLGLSKLVSQYIVRAVLATAVGLAFREFRWSVEGEFGRPLSVWLTLITASQFHFMFYMSRPLPNTFALVCVLLAYSFWFRQKHRSLIVVTAVTVLVFRSELALLLGLILLIEILSARLKLWYMLKVGIPTGLAVLLATVVVDSYFWQRLVWPEGEVLLFNVVLNKSSDWGTAPWSWYFYSAIPRALGCTLLLLPVGLIVDARLKLILVPAVGYVMLYSFLPHKELRFIMYIFPLLNLTAARACWHYWNNRLKSLFNVFVVLLLCLHLVVNLFTSTLLLLISMHNYPGGFAFARLHEIEKHSAYASVHIDNLAAQTGVSRFGELKPHWVYNKTENLQAGCTDMHRFTHLLIEGKSAHSSSFQPYKHTHDILEVVPAYSHLKFDYTRIPPVFIRTKARIMILRKKVLPTQVIVDFDLKKQTAQKS